MTTDSGGTQRPRAGVRFFFFCLLISSFYFVLEALYIERFPLIVDEFQGAAATRAMLEQIPYRDLLPYKTVLGQYLQLPFLLMSDDPWESIMIGKLATAAMVAVALLTVAMMLARSFSRRAVLLALAMLVCMSTFLERSGEFRVDMLTGLGGLFGLVYLVRRQPIRAGILCGLAFLISQKGIYYILAGGAVYAWMVIAGVDRRRALRSGVFFSTAVAVTVFLYALAWSLVSDLPTVLGSMFLSPQRMAFADLYYIRGQFWTQVISRDPFYILLTLAALALMGMLKMKRTEDPIVDVLLPYGVALFALGVWHKQPWPYFFVLLIPTAFVLHAFLFDWMQRNISSDRVVRTGFLAGVLILCIAIPLLRLDVTLRRSNTLQEETLALIRSSVGPGELYLAGLNLVYDREHAMTDVLGWLDTPRGLDLLRRGPVVHAQLRARMERSPIKLVVVSYRTTKLPGPLKDHIRAEFTPFWGPVLIYGPEVPCGEFTIKFPGRYRLLSEHAGSIRIDGQPVEPGGVVALREGVHHAECSEPLRLRWYDPELEKRYVPGLRTDENFYPNVYSF